MTLAQALLTEAVAVGLTVRRHGTRIALVAPTPPPADLVKRLREAKPVLLAALPDDDAEERAAILECDAHLPRHDAERLAKVPVTDDGPQEPCLCCGWRTFWRPSGTREPWLCCGCVSVPRTNWTDCVALPPKAVAQ